MSKDDWIVIDEDDPETFPKADEDESSDYVLLSFSNMSDPLIGRYEGSTEDGFSFYAGDDDETLQSMGIFVNAWQPLPKCYDG